MRCTPPDQYLTPIQTEKYNELPFDPGKTLVTHINNDSCYLVTTCWKSASPLNLKHTKEISIRKDEHGYLFIDNVVRYLIIVKDHIQVKDSDISIVYDHCEHQSIYLYMTMGSDTSIIHDYAKLQMVYKN